MKSRYLLAILATAFVMVILFSKDKKNKVKQASTENSEETIPVKLIVRTDAAPVLQASTENKAAVVPEPVLETRQVPASIQQKFSLHLKAMSKCLRFADPSVPEMSEPTTEFLIATLRPAIGDMVVQMDDWSQTEFLDQGPSKKRVRVDYDYPDGAMAVRRLSMYQINSYGMPEIVNLTADEVNNPNEAYVASLYEGRKIVTEEKGGRAYFSDGEELIYSVRNGLLQSVSINKGDHSFNCFNLDEENSSCTCP